MMPCPSASLPAGNDVAPHDAEVEAAHIQSSRLADLLEAVASRRDENAFATLYRFFAPRLKAFGIRQGASPTIAEDLAQETMLAVWRRANSFDRCRATASTWVFTISRNKRIDLQRRTRTRDFNVHDVTIHGDVCESPESSTVRTLAGDALRKAIQNLPPKQVEVLQLAYLDGQSHREIADRLSLPLGTIKSRIRLALARLRCPELASWVH